MKWKKIVSVVLIISLFFSLFSSVEAFASEKKTTITVENATAAPGDTVSVKVGIKDNPNIIGAVLKVSYSDSLELVDSNSGEAFSGLSMTKPGKYESPCQFIWDAVDAISDAEKDGEILILTFKVSDTVSNGDSLDIKLSYSDGDIIDSELNPVDVDLIDGKIDISSYIPGDVNGDSKVNTTDVILVRRFIAGGYDVSINKSAGDVNADGKVNATDVILMRRFIAGGYTNSNGEPLVLLSGKTTNDSCEHSLVATAYKAPTCTEKGNIAYWYCDKCGKYYKDANGTAEVSQDKLEIEANGHTPVIDPAVQATSTKPGLTEGSHCSVCGIVLVPQETISSNMFEIKYNIANGDTYLAKLQINNPNPSSIGEGESVYLKDIETDGYQFLGWFDGAGDNAEQIKRITNADHSMTLYAHWKRIEYTIQFKSDLVPIESITYTTKEGKILPSPTLDGYTFVGWTDFDGNMYTQIKAGTKGDITLYANWISDRNRAWAKKKLDDPLVYDDGDVILFTYEIGEIRDVPIYEIENFGKINKDGVSQTVTKKYSVTTSEQLMNTYTKTVENATTKTDTWTLSNGWSDSFEVNEEWCNQHNITKEEAETRGKSETGNWYVSNSKGGSSSTTTIDSTDTYDLTTTTNNTRSWSDDYQEKIDHGDDVKHGNGATIGGEAGYKVSASGNAGVVKIRGEGSVKISGEYEQHKETTEKGSDTTTMKGSVSDYNVVGQQGSVSNHTSNSTNTSNWNMESGYGGSSTTSSSKTVSSAISEMISEKTGYGSTYVNDSEESNTQGLTSYSSDIDSYSSAVTYSKVESSEVEMTYTTTNTKSGYHRWVMAGTAHVFGVVGYDIASKSYFVYTYSVMDDEMHRFEDYSYNTSSYDDNQNGVIPFEIPYEIADYVNARVFATDGLEIDENGIITDYSGTDSYVVIPDYMPIDNKDGSINVIKVVGLDENAFKGNKDITGVKLSRYIDEIPRNAFRGCSKLWQIDAFVTSVGDNAFKDCPLLSKWDISSAVTKLGNNAFDGAQEFTVKAANTSVVKSAINSGAKDITIGLNRLTDSLDDTTLTVPSGTEAIAFNAYGGTYNNLSIISNAERTDINRMNINSDGVMPLQITSKDIQINQSKITNTGICAAFTANDLTLDLYGASTMESAGPNALFCKDTDVVRTTAGLKTSLTLTGNLVTCGSINDPNSYIKFAEGTNGKIVVVDADTFESMLRAYKLTFDANGGECSETSKQVDNGTPVGTLPVPTREGYDFEGWYTSDNILVTADKVFSTGKDLTVIAKWKVKEYIATWESKTGCTIAVKRTLSPYKNASTGFINSGDMIYYGDTLTISYVASDGYMIGENGDTLIIVNNNVTSNNIYAKVGKLSNGWELASNMPMGATLLDEKWTYDKITNIESDVEEVDGYTLYDTSFVWCDYGPWSSWSNTKATASDSRKVETRNIAATYKTQYNYDKWCQYNSATSGGWSGPSKGTWSGVYCQYHFERGWSDSRLSLYTWSGSTPLYGQSGDTWYNESTRQVQVTPAYTQYRYCDRYKIYTYYLTKTDSLESSTEVTSSEGIENIQRWVKYVVY